MKKRIILLLAFVLVFGMSVFAGGESETESMAEEKIQIRIGIWPEETQSADVELNLALKEQFEALYPNIEIIPAFYKYAPDNFLPLAAAGELPTVFDTWFTEPPQIIDAGYAADITDIAAKYGYDQDMNPAVKELLSENGRLYGLPRDGYALGLYINMNLFREAGLVDSNGLPMYPKTFDELTEVAKTITERTGKAGMFIATAYNVGGWHFSNLAWNFGATFTKVVNGKVMAKVDSPEVAAAVRYVRDLKWEHGVLLDNLLLGWGEWIQYFATDEVAMCFAASDVVALPVNDYGMDKDSIAIAPIPQGPNGDQYSLFGGTPYMFSPTATEAEIDAAMKWLEFSGLLNNLQDEALEGKRLDIQLDAENGWPVGPQRIKVWTDRDYIETLDSIYEEFENVNMQLYKDYYSVSQFNLRPEIPYFAQDIYALLDGVLQAVLSDENADIGKLLEEANRLYQENYLDTLE